jgi:cysteine desulfurase
VANPYPSQLVSARGYFDNNATTPVDPRVRAAMLPWLGELHGNASSVHRFGRQAREAVERARDQVARMLAVEPLEIVFTGSGTEANNAVIESCCRVTVERGAGHLLISAFEHPSIEASAKRFEERGGRVTRVAPESDGVIDAGRFAAAIEEDTRLACLMLANNELGTIQPVGAVEAACREHSVQLLCDATQAAGKIAVNVPDLGADFVVLAAHKFHGPLGAAALRISGDCDLRPLLVGGGQERQRRSGTLNVAAIVGLGLTCELAAAELESRACMLADLQDRFEAGLQQIDGAVVHCTEAPRLPNTSHVAIPDLSAEVLLIRLDLEGFAVSAGSACAAGAAEASPALAALGLDEGEIRGSLRVSFGITNTPDEVDELLAALGRVTSSLRSGLGEVSG